MQVLRQILVLWHTGLSFNAEKQSKYYLYAWFVLDLFLQALYYRCMLYQGVICTSDSRMSNHVYQWDCLPCFCSLKPSPPRSSCRSPSLRPSGPCRASQRSPPWRRRCGGSRRCSWRCRATGSSRPFTTGSSSRWRTQSIWKQLDLTPSTFVPSKKPSRLWHLRLPYRILLSLAEQSTCVKCGRVSRTICLIFSTCFVTISSAAWCSSSSGTSSTASMASLVSSSMPSLSLAVSNRPEFRHDKYKINLS